MADPTYNVRIEVPVAENLYDQVDCLSREHGLTHQEFIIASIGLLNEAQDLRFRAGQTELIGNLGRQPLPPLVAPDTVRSQMLRATLSPRLYDPLSDYVSNHYINVPERARRAFRFGCFVLDNATPRKDHPIMFWHQGDNVGIPFRTER